MRLRYRRSASEITQQAALSAASISQERFGYPNSAGGFSADKTSAASSDIGVTDEYSNEQCMGWLKLQEWILQEEWTKTE